MSQSIETISMSMDFDGLLRLLVKNIYTKKDAFLRELIQNAHDAILARQQLDRDHAGRIDVSYNTAEHTLRVSDNGIGMDESEVRSFLSVIGASSKRGPEAHPGQIGRFGVGILSAFLVADSVTVVTLRLGSSVAFGWRNRGAAECDFFKAERSKPGTDVTLHVARDHAYLLDKRRLGEIVRRYMDFLPLPIHVQDDDRPVNVRDAPWYQAGPGRAEDLAAHRQVIQDHHNELPLDVIPVAFTSPSKVQGVLYIPALSVPGIDVGGAVDLYVKRVFVKGADASLLPSWARFVRGIMDCPDLEPNVARDGVLCDSPEFASLQNKLAELVVERLKHLARHEPTRFAEINLRHHHHLKGMAAKHDDFFREVGELLVFSTNRGPLSLRDCLAKNRPDPTTGSRIPVYYVSSFGAADQFYRLADVRDWTVIDASSAFDEALLQTYEKANRTTVQLVCLDNTDHPSLFERVDEHPNYDKFARLAADLELLLRQAKRSSAERGARPADGGVTVEPRRFLPAEIPTALITTPETEAQRMLDQFRHYRSIVEGFEDVRAEANSESRLRPAQMFLNIENPVVQSLVAEDRSGHDLDDLLLSLHNSAYLLSRNLLVGRNAEIIHQQMLRSFFTTLELRQRSRAQAAELEGCRRQLLDLRRDQSPTEPTSDHVVLFMMTPFADEYRAVEQAVRRVFEARPYYFEVRLARDYTLSDSLIDNVRKHMRDAHGFVADITGLNPNVMMELGAILLPKDERPLICLMSDDVKQVPADLAHRLRLQYPTVNDPVETIESALREALERDGLVRHHAVTTLLGRRRRRYLSRTILESIPNIVLTDSQIDAILSRYRFVEELADMQVRELARRTSLAEHLVGAIRGELRIWINAEQE